MKALFVGDGGISFREAPRPTPGEGEALIRVRCAGICSTDLEIVRGYAGYAGILGHEFVGEVVATGAERDQAWIGRRVTGSINIGCGACPVCLGQGPEHCPHRSVLGILNWDGAFAEFLRLPVDNLHPVPDSLSDEVAAFTEPLAAALRIREQAAIRPTERMAVIGPGRLGLLIAQVLALGAADLTVLGRSEASLALPAELGLRVGHTDDASDASFDLVVEATGNPAGLAAAMRLVRPLGRLVLKSTYAGAASLDLSPLVVQEIQVIGSRCGPFAPALRLLEAGGVGVRPLIDGRYPLAEARAALAYAAQPGVRKVLLFP